MTEQQFEKIKELLDKSSSVDTSSELDTKILDAAMHQAKLNKATRTPSHKPQNVINTVICWLREVGQGSAAQAAIFSLVLTFAVFVGMAQLLNVDQQTVFADSKNKVIEFQINDQRTTTYSTVADTTSGVDLRLNAFKMPETQQARDQILASMSLPDIQSLIDEVVLPTNSDRQFTESVISVAMNDIHFMLDNGKLNDARLRYATLKKRCSECALPDSLEALVSISFSSVNST